MAKKLTLYIMIGLIFGIIVGAVMHEVMALDAIQVSVVERGRVRAQVRHQFRRRQCTHPTCSQLQSKRQSFQQVTDVHNIVRVVVQGKCRVHLARAL